MSSKETEKVMRKSSNLNGLDPNDWQEMNANGWMDEGSLVDRETLMKLINDPNTEKKIDPETGLEYMRTGDYWVPTLLPPKPEKEEARPVGKYGQMRLAYLENHKKGLLATLRSQGRLREHLADTEEAAHQRVETIMKQMLEKDPPPDKATHQMEWVQHMNMTKAQAEEMVMELIYE
jgi:hypothetical protein